MAYTLHAIIAKNGILSQSHFEAGKVVSLRQGYEMLPFTDEFTKIHNIPFLPLTDGKPLPENIKAICSTLSGSNRLAYVEAEFFGGDGTQACVVFNNKQIEFGPLVSQDAINKALSLLGVNRQKVCDVKNTTRIGFILSMLGLNKQRLLDEFETLGLNAHRDTEKWVQSKWTEI